PLATETLERALRGLADACMGAGQHAKAVEARRGLLDTLRARRGSDHRTTLLAMVNLAHCYRAAGPPDKAVPLLEEGVVRWRAKSPLERSLPDALVKLAEVYRDTGRVREAEDKYREAIGYYRQLWGPDNLNLAASQSDLGAVLLEQQHY